MCQHMHLKIIKGKNKKSILIDGSLADTKLCLYTVSHTATTVVLSHHTHIRLIESGCLIMSNSNRLQVYYSTLATYIQIDGFSILHSVLSCSGLFSIVLNIHR